MTVAPTSVRARRPRRRHVALAAAVVLLIAIGMLLLVRAHLFKDSTTSTGVQGSGVAATQMRKVAPFNSVQLAGSNNVTIRVGENQSVVVHGDDNLLDRVTTQVHAGELVIGNTTGSFTTKSPMSVEVRVPALGALALTGSGTISASGTARRLDVTLPGSGMFQLEDLVAGDVRGVVSGSGTIFVTATESLDASVPGTGAIIYGGNPKHVTTSITGSGSVSRR